MKKERPSRSASIHFRVLIAFTLCLAGLSLAVTAFGAWPGLTTAAWVGSHHQTARDSKIKITNRKRAPLQKELSPVRSRTAKNSVGGPTTPSNPAAQTPLDPSALSTVSQHTNALGQTVYSISPSRFDVSPPLTELATLTLPKPPEQQLAEPELPPWRIPRSDRPDPVTQVAPASQRFREPSGRSGGAGRAHHRFQFRGHSRTQGSFPPDTNGSVGNDQYVETVNTQLSGVVAQSRYQHSHVARWPGRHQYALGRLRRRRVRPRMPATRSCSTTRWPTGG